MDPWCYQGERSGRSLVASIGEWCIVLANCYALMLMEEFVSTLHKMSAVLDGGLPITHELC